MRRFHHSIAAARIAEKPDLRPKRRGWERYKDCVCVVLLVGLCLLIGMTGVRSTGPLWNDGPRYANAAAMIHDWISSGALLSPVQFAQQRYAQFPGFSVPFHPPGYPGMLGLFFFLTGVNYVGARLFVALCGGVAASAFFGIARVGGTGSSVAALSATLLVSTPEFAKWSRCTMSEVPSTALMLVASLVFVVWCERRHPWLCWSAFLIAGLAFFSRVTTVTIIPVWFTFLAVAYGLRRVVNVHLIVAAGVYVVIAVAWVSFVAHYARYEVAADKHGVFGTLAAVSQFVDFVRCLRPCIAWGTIYAAAAGVLFVLWSRRSSRAFTFFAAWLLVFCTFKILMPTSNEIRHAFGMLPGLAGLALGIAPSTSRKRVMYAVMVLGAIAINVMGCRTIPRGVVGYDLIAERLAQLRPAGNVLMCCWDDQELMFRYQAAAGETEVQMLRGDRLLAIRLPGYAKTDATTLATTDKDVLDVVRKGRVRYLITCSPSQGSIDRRFPEMKLAHQCATSHKDSFQLEGKWPLSRDYDLAGPRSEVYVWRYLKRLEPGPSELPVLVPTARMVLLLSGAKAENESLPRERH